MPFPRSYDTADAAERARRYLTKHHGRVADLPADPDAMIDTFLVWTHSNLSKIAQAEVLGVTRGVVKQRRRHLYDAGRIDPNDRAYRPPITDAAAESIRRLYAAGYSRESIVALQQASEYRVDTSLYRRGPRPARAEYFGKSQVAELFGVTRFIVDEWIALGWLPCAKSQPERRSSWHRWLRADLAEFIRNRATWVAYHERQITDPELRRLAELERAQAGGRWVTRKEIAHALGVTPSTIKHYASELGYLADWPTTTTYGKTFYYWLRDGEPLPPLPTARRYRAAAD